jgi:acyl-CoA thioesterase-1
VAALLFNAILILIAMPALAKTPEILAFGDSLTAGLGLPASEAFPAQLQARLKSEGVDVKIANAGVSGDTTSDGLARLDWALADKPDYVILALGANDMLRGIDPKIVRANLDKMIEKIQASGQNPAARHALVARLGAAVRARVRCDLPGSGKGA